MLVPVSFATPVAVMCVCVVMDEADGTEGLALGAARMAKGRGTPLANNNT